MSSLLSFFLYLFAFLTILTPSLVFGQGGGGEGESGGESSEGEGSSSEGGSSGGGGGSNTDNPYAVSTPCNYIYGVEVPIVTPTDTCVGTYLPTEESSYQYICNDAGDEVSLYTYETSDCSGTGTLNTTFTDSSDSNANVSFTCDGYDCTVLIHLFDNVTNDCSHTDYYRSQAYVENACVQWFDNSSYVYNCGANNSIAWRIYQESSSCSSSSNPLVINLADGCNFDEGLNTTSFSEHVTCNEQPTQSPTVDNTNEDEDDAACGKSGLISVTLVAVVAALWK